MKRILAIFLVLLLASGAVALAEEAWSFDEPIEGDSFDEFIEDDSYDESIEDYSYVEFIEGDSYGEIRYVVNCDEYISLRLSPSNDAEMLDRIPLGAEVVHLGDVDGSYSEVEYNGQIGYVLTEYLGNSAPQMSEAESFMDYVPDGSDYAFFPEYAPDTDVEFLDGHGAEEYDFPFPEFANEVNTTMYIAHCDEYVSLRSYPDTDASSLKRLSLGTAVTWYGTYNTKFSEVSCDGVMGYVLTKYLSDSPSTGPSSSSKGAYLGSDIGYSRLSTSKIEVYASSEQKDQYGYYSAANANDANSSTTWSEGASGIGKDEWLSFFFDEREVVGFAIRAGHQKSSDVYKKNNRPKQITISVADEDSISVTLQDTRSEQIVLFNEPVTTDYLSIELASAYSGSKYSDTCITDIRILLAD